MWKVTDALDSVPVTIKSLHILHRGAKTKHLPANVVVIAPAPALLPLLLPALCALVDVVQADTGAEHGSSEWSV